MTDPTTRDVETALMMADDAAKQGLRGLFPLAAQTLAAEVRRLRQVAAEQPAKDQAKKVANELRPQDAWFSAQAAALYGTKWWLTADGSEVEITAVADESAYMWADKQYLGKVVRWLRDGRIGSEASWAAPRCICHR